MPKKIRSILSGCAVVIILLILICLALDFFFPLTGVWTRTESNGQTEVWAFAYDGSWMHAESASGLSESGGDMHYSAFGVICGGSYHRYSLAEDGRQITLDGEEYTLEANSKLLMFLPEVLRRRAAPLVYE